MSISEADRRRLAVAVSNQDCADRLADQMDGLSSTVTAATITTLTAPTINATNIDAGASGTAGTVDVFPATASKGKLAISCANQTGNTTVSLTTAAMAAARTITIPDPLASAEVRVGKNAAVAVTATADGLTTGIIADGGYYQHVTVTSSSSTNIVTLPTPTPGVMLVIDVGSNGFKLQSSTPASVAINGGTGASAKSTIAANSTLVMICISSTAWKGFFLDADSDVAKVPAAA